MSSTSTTSTEVPIQQPGVQNPKIIDLITTDSSTGEVVMKMIEFRSWKCKKEELHGRLVQLQNKVDSYLSYILDGFFLQQYPQYKDKTIRIELESTEALEGEFIRFFEAAQTFSGSNGIQFLHVVKKSWDRFKYRQNIVI